MGRQIHARFEAVQSHFSDLTTLAQENLAGVRVVRAFRQEDAEIARFDALNEGYLEKNMRLARLYGLMQPGVLDFRRTGNGRCHLVRRSARRERNTVRRQLRGVRHVPRHAHLAAHRARLGHQPVSARRRLDDAPARHSRRAIDARRTGAAARRFPPSAAGRT